MPSIAPLGKPDRRPKTRILIWQVMGAIWILVTGSLLHFAFEHSGYWRPIAAFVPVNESVWEHLKMVFWPGVSLALLEYRVFAKEAANFTTAKCSGLCSMPLVIVALFYAYTAILGDNQLIFDILIFAIAIVVGQWIGYSLLIHPYELGNWRLPSRLGLTFFLIAFPVFTFYPPHLFLFEHAETGTYGIIEGSRH